MDKIVSVVITTHNRLNLLKKAIESVMAQTYKNIECIVVDDCSTDDTKSFCESLKYIKYIRIDINESKGGNYARNVGIKNSIGDYVAFLDDDDFWVKSKIEKQVEIFNENINTGVVFCGFIIIDKYGVEKSRKSPYIKRKENIEKRIMYSIVSVTSAIMVKRNLLFQAGLFDENLKYWQEYELTIRLAQITQFDYVDEYLMYYLSDTTDKNRLTNNYNSWKLAVDYIKEKHKNLYKKISFIEKFQYKLLVIADAVKRTNNSKLKHKHKILKLKMVFLKYSLMIIRLPKFLLTKIA